MKKNRKKVRVLSILMVTVLASVLVIGCSSKSEDESKKTNSENKISSENKEDADSKGEVSDKIVLEASVINDIESKLSMHEDNIKTLEEKLQNATSQFDMNQTSGEIAVAWSDFLDSLLNTIEENAEAEAWKKFEQEQSEWAGSRETAVREAGLKFEGGSMQALEENSTAARLTKERVYEIIDDLK